MKIRKEIEVKREWKVEKENQQMKGGRGERKLSKIRTRKNKKIREERWQKSEDKKRGEKKRGGERRRGQSS